MLRGRRAKKQVGFNPTLKRLRLTFIAFTAEKITSVYGFLTDYKDGDEIYLFG